MTEHLKVCPYKHHDMNNQENSYHSRIEIAANFKEQGNEIVREKERQNYHAAIAYYTKALAQRCADMQLNIACLLNRAQVNLELQNYGSCIRDCQQAIRTGGGELETKSLSKALFRLGKAFLSLDKLEEANSALRYGRKVNSWIHTIFL